MFGERLKALRTKAGLSQKALATKLFISQQAVAGWELEKGSPNPETLLRIAEILNVSADYLLGRTDQKEEKPTPEDGDGHSGNVVKIAGRDGSFYERKVSDSQREMLIQMLDNLISVDDENV